MTHGRRRGTEATTWLLLVRHDTKLTRDNKKMIPWSFGNFGSSLSRGEATSVDLGGRHILWHQSPFTVHLGVVAVAALEDDWQQQQQQQQQER
jgi:hypothetical protein